MPERKKVGVCGVDSGQILLCDPCYIDSEWEEKDFLGGGTRGDRTHEFSYDGCCRETLSEEKVGQLNFKKGHAGAGVVVSSGLGDGVYPVYVTYAEGRIQKVEIIFFGQEEED